MAKRLVTSAGLLALGGLTSFLLLHRPVVLAHAEGGVGQVVLRAQELADDELDPVSPNAPPLDRALASPTGEPTSLGCDDARTIVQQARASLAAPGPQVDAAKFAEATSDWLDPHGLWSVAPDAPAGATVRRAGERLLGELTAPPGSGPCSAALEIGAELQSWASELGRLFDQGAHEGSEKRVRTQGEAFQLAAATPFEDGAVTRSARELARELGREVGAVKVAYGAPISPFADAARARAAPSLDAEAWSRVVIAAALRAYIPQLDAHGAWAPLEEEISIYDLSLEAEPPERLWTEMTRTALGVRIVHGAHPPLENGDVVLKVQDVALAGVSVEQAEQLSVVSDGHSIASTRVEVLRARSQAPLELVVTPDSSDGPVVPPAAPSELPVEMMRYGDGRVAVLGITDVPDDLGARVESALARAREARDLRGVVLDLRANGGGSTDGAIATLGIFLPGVPLFPMRRRDGGVEIERAPDVAEDRRYAGPLAVLVDGDSASAAEMLAGGLASYHRATVIGDRTYGKGCAQEYLEDDAHAGVLRLTTLLFALPDGAPVQKTGIFPGVQLSLPQATEREASVARALDPWKGPDVRDPARVREVAWAAHGGHVGPCRDAVVCRALRSLGSSPAAAR